MKFDLATLDLAYGAHTIKVKAKASGYNDSEFSNEVTYTKAPAAPTITLTGSTISWTAVTGATGYRIIATADVAKQTDTTSTSFDLSTWSDLTAGTWTVQVLSTNGTVYSDSSNTVTYTVQNKLATPTIAIDGNTLKITDVENAQRYKIYANGELKTTITTQTSLQPPTTVNLNGNVLTWNNVANNSGYEILYRRTDGSGEIYQTDIVETNVTQHTLTVTTAGTYSVTIVTIGTGSYTDSEESAAVTYTVQAQLAAPTIAMNADGKTLEITDVENATSYDVYVDGTLKTNVQSMFTVTIVKDQKVTGSTNITYIKKDSAPTSGSDYTYHVYDGYPDPPFEANKVYIWGYGYKIDNGDIIYLNKSTYTSATEITLTKDVTITLLGTEVGGPV